MPRARADVSELAADLVGALARIRSMLDLSEPQPEAAWAQIEKFCAISLSVFATSNPSKLAHPG